MSLETLKSIPPLAVAIIGAAVGLWLMLPRGQKRGRRPGILIALVSLAGIGAEVSRWLTVEGGVDWVGSSIFFLLAAVTVTAAGAMITSRIPVYSAVWFGLVLLGTAGLFLFQGAQFLGIATVAVYAGAILVMFLFVLMLTQTDGHAYYDRLSWEPLISSATGAVMLGMLVTVVRVSLADPGGLLTDPTPQAKVRMVVGKADQPVAVDSSQEGDQGASGEDGGVASLPEETPRSRELTEEEKLRQAEEKKTRQSALQAKREKELRQGILQQDHVARLGQELFGRYLVAIEVAATLLLAALVGAVAIVAQGKITLPEDSQQEGDVHA